MLFADKLIIVFLLLIIVLLIIDVYVRIDEINKKYKK